MIRAATMLDVLRDKYAAKRQFDESKVNRAADGRFGHKSGEMVKKAKGAEGVGKRVAKKDPPPAKKPAKVPPKGKKDPSEIKLGGAAKSEKPKKLEPTKSGQFHTDVADIVRNLDKTGLETRVDYPGAKFGQKIFIGHVWEAFKKKNPGATRADFNKQLLDANKAGHLKLARADLVGAMNRKDVDGSEISHPATGDRLHFIRADSLPAEKSPAKSAKAKAPPAKSPTKPAAASAKKPAPKPATKPKPAPKAKPGAKTAKKAPPKPKPKPAGKKPAPKAPKQKKAPQKAPPKASPKGAKKLPPKNPSGAGLDPAAKAGTNKNLWPYVSTDKTSQANASAQGVGAELASAAAGVTPKGFSDKIAEAKKTAPAAMPAAAKPPRNRQPGSIPQTMRRIAMAGPNAGKKPQGLWARIKAGWAKNWAKPKIPLREPGEGGMLGWARAFARATMHTNAQMSRQGQRVRYSLLDGLRDAVQVDRYAKGEHVPRGISVLDVLRAGFAKA